MKNVGEMSMQEGRELLFDALQKLKSKEITIKEANVISAQANKRLRAIKKEIAYRKKNNLEISENTMPYLFS